MARMRTVKPEFFRSAKIGQLDARARLLFIGMWTEADDHGRGLAAPKHLAGTLFPFDRDVTERRIAAWLWHMSDLKLIRLYEANGSGYYEIVGWWHQRVNRPQPPRYPAPSDSVNGTDHDSLNGTPQNALPAAVNGTTSGIRYQGSGVKGQGSGSDLTANALALDSPSRAPGSAKAIEQAEIDDDALREIENRRRIAEGLPPRSDRNGKPESIGDLIRQDVAR